MTIEMVRGIEITRPTTTPLKSSVLDHARAAGNLDDVPEDTGFGFVNSNGLWISYNQLETLTPVASCPEPLLSETGGFKTFDTADWVPSMEFNVYGGVQCKTVGLDREDQHRELERVFTLNEGRGVEEALLGNRFIAQATDPDNPLAGSWGAPTDISPSSDVSARVAIGLLEGWFARHYAGVPTLHMPRALGTILGSDIIEWRGDLAFTRMGSKVAFGGGYDEEIPDGTMDIYATGEVFVQRSATVSIKAIQLDTASRVGQLDTGLAPNTAISLVERMFRVAVDGPVAKATATVTGVTGGGFTV
jgi:hypothetical protein